VTATQLPSAGVVEVEVAAPDTPALRIDGLRVTVRGGVEAVRGVTFDVRAGEAVGVVGESGSGKTLTCRAVLGVLPPGAAVAAGTVALGDTDLTTLDPAGWAEVRRHGLGAVFQDPGSYLNPSLNVARQVIPQIRLCRGVTRRTARANAAELLRAVGLRDPEAVLRQYPHQLSGGMAQRVMLALALAGRPRLLVADEATTALDAAVAAEVLDLLGALRRAYGLALLLVSHDLAIVADTCDRVVVLYAGEVVESGPTAEVLAAPRHPYTEALLGVASLGDWERRELRVIDGAPPGIGDTTPGCRFAPRCRYAVAACTAKEIPMTGGDHAARCVR
jgi:peptide/nickel transport system ATP-binding protein